MMLLVIISLLSVNPCSRIILKALNNARVIFNDMNIIEYIMIIQCSLYYVLYAICYQCSYIMSADHRVEWPCSKWFVHEVITVQQLQYTKVIITFC